MRWPVVSPTSCSLTSWVVSLTCLVVSLTCCKSFRLRVISRWANAQKVVLRNDLTRKRDDSRRLRTGRRGNDSLAKHTCRVYIFSPKSSVMKSYLYILKTLFWLLRKQSDVPTMFIFWNPFFEPPANEKVGLNYQELRNIGIKIKEFDGEKEVSFGLSFFEVLRIEGLDSIRFSRLSHFPLYMFLFSFY